MDLISREEALLWTTPEDWGTPDEVWRPESEYGRYIQSLPSAEPKIIRCKECKYYREYTGAVDGCGRCHMAEWYKRYQYPDDFCSKAERRTDE